MLLEKFQHRVGNSLAIIASIISLKARSVDSIEGRRHLDDARDRVISFATIQQSLHTSADSGFIELVPHFPKLCQAISHSMIGDNQWNKMETRDGGRASSREAESLGLIVTELVINSLKHAFTGDTIDGRNTGACQVSGTVGSSRIRTTGLASWTQPIDPRADLAPALSRRLQNNWLPRS
jgi:chemotaxis protein methyltransferase CheR